MSGGAVARIRLYDGPLTESQVARLSTTAPAPSVSTSVSSAARSTKITVSGRNFGPREFVSVTLEDFDGQFAIAGHREDVSRRGLHDPGHDPGWAHRGAGAIIAEAGWSGLRAKTHFSVR